MVGATSRGGFLVTPIVNSRKEAEKPCKVPYYLERSVLTKGCITANVLQTSKVDAQCDKPATELNWQRFASKVANFQRLYLHLTYSTCSFWFWFDLMPPLGDDPLWGLPRFSASRNQSSWAIVWRCLRDPTFRRFSRTPTCGRQTDEQTDGQTGTRRQLIPALASITRVKL